ncbi:LysR family transcriptional regulator substrate-binding protein [Polaromonas sp. P1(28)-8]|nr:LysR family transcriptional regulator substrate-binding protein [Polaromonas sp. P1(28)-8]
MTTIGPTRMSRFFQHFHQGNPGIELTVRDATLPGLLHDLERGDLDLAVVSSPRDLGDTFRTEPLYRERYVVVFPPGHRLERLEGIALNDLAGEDYVDRLACELREAVMAACGQRKVELYAAFLQRARGLGRIHGAGRARLRFHAGIFSAPERITATATGRPAG